MDGLTVVVGELADLLLPLLRLTRQVAMPQVRRRRLGPAETAAGIGDARTPHAGDLCRPEPGKLIQGRSLVMGRHILPEK